MAGDGKTQKKRKGAKKAKKMAREAVAAPVGKQAVVAKKRAAKPNYQGFQAMNGLGQYVSEPDFVKMTLDPCHGPLTASPFGKTENSYIWRLNYRGTVGSNTSGNLMACLFPNGVFNGFGSASANLPQLLQLWNYSTLSDGTAPLNSQVAFTVPGIQALEGVAAQVRVTAGCIKLNYVGSANNAQGQLYAWEGQGDENFASIASSQLLTTKSSPNSYMMSGMTAPVTSGVESMLNFSKVATEDQWKFGDIQVGRTDVYCPCAVVGVSGGPPSTNYVLEATIIVEWTPLLSQGVPAPVAASVKPGAAERVANTLRRVAPLLVRAASIPVGGYAGMMSKAVTFGAQVYQALRA